MKTPPSDLRVTWPPPVPVPGTHPYFDALSARPEKSGSWALRTDSQIKSLETVKFGWSQTTPPEWRYPVIYDPAADAACWRIYPKVNPATGIAGSTDGEGKRLPLNITSGSMLFTWDLRFDAGHAYLALGSSGYIERHKTYMVGWHAPSSGDNRWLGIRTDYRNAFTKKQGLAELVPYFAEDRWCASGTTLGAQTTIQPRAGSFFLNADTWTRVWVYVEGIGQPVSFLTIWAADATRGPVMLQNRNAVIVPPGGLTKFWFEYDTSQETATNPEMRSWNRNAVVLRNVAASNVPALLQRPLP